MSAWKYCHKCNAKVNAPTYVDVLIDCQHCPECSANMEIGEIDREEAAKELKELLDSMQQRISNLEEKQILSYKMLNKRAYCI